MQLVDAGASNWLQPAPSSYFYRIEIADMVRFSDVFEIVVTLVRKIYAHLFR